MKRPQKNQEKDNCISWWFQQPLMSLLPSVRPSSGDMMVKNDKITQYRHETFIAYKLI